MDTPQDTKSAEPTMEEILASIRRIIADEKDPAAEEKPKEEDVLELTQMVQEDGTVVDLSASAPPQPSPPPQTEEVAKVQVPEERPIPKPETVAPPIATKTDVDEGLVSEQSTSAAASSLASLVSTVKIERMAAAVPISATPFGHGNRTLEDMVEELIRPMLKEWLDQNLPILVERLVQKEIERIAKRVED